MIKVLGDSSKGRRYDPNLATSLNNMLAVNPSSVSVKSENTNNAPIKPKERFTYLMGDFIRFANNEIQAAYAGYEVISKVVYKDGFLKGANPFYVVAMNEYLKHSHMQVATQADLEMVLRNSHPLSTELPKHYIDTSLVWRSNEGANEYLARDIAAQCAATHITLQKGMPCVFPLRYMKLRKDDKSPQGLAFDLKKDKYYFAAPILQRDVRIPEGSQCYFDAKDIEPSTGLPTSVKTEKGKRAIWIDNVGLCRLGFSKNLSIYSASDNLDWTSEEGRIIVKCGGKK